MDKLIYETLWRYFNSLTKLGYVKDSVVAKILVTLYIYDCISNDFRYYVTDKDIKLMQDLLYQFFGSTCEISFPGDCCCCKCLDKDEKDEPSITGFAMIPNTTRYEEAGARTFTGCTYNITTNDNYDESSFTVYLDNAVIYGPVNAGSLTRCDFITAVTANLAVGRYVFKASIADLEGNIYYSNNFTVNVTKVTEVAVMYSGVGATAPTVGDVQKGSQSSSSNFQTPAYVNPNRYLWIAIPDGVELVSVENANFQGDFLYNRATGRDVGFETSSITIDDEPYTLWVLHTALATNNPYNVIVEL